MNSWEIPPRWFTWLCVLVVIGGLFITVAGAIQIGVTVDETFHVVRLRNYLDQGWYLLDDDLGPSGPGAWVADAYVYAPVATLALHLPNVLIGYESWGQVSAEAGAYVVRHLGVAAIGLSTVAAAAAASRIISGSWRWAVVTAAVLFCLPMWTGHSMFNVKDIPVAAGYTYVTLGCILMLTLHRGARRSRLLTVALILAGLLLGVGTRPAIWPGLVAALGCVVLLVVARLLHGERQEWWRVGDVAAALAMASVLLALVYPVVFTHPTEWLLGAATESAGYQGRKFRGYIPVTVASTVPVLLLLLGIAGSMGRLRHRLSRRPIAWDLPDMLMALVVLQALLLPSLLVLRVAALNGGLRHVMFAAPAAAILITAGIAQILGDLKGQRAHAVAAAMASVGLVAPLAVQFQLFPYGYAYANFVPDATGIELPADFWQASFREYADDLASTDFAVCGTKLDDDARPLRQMPNGGQSWLILGDDCARNGALSVLQPFHDSSTSQLMVAPTFVALFVYDDPPPRGCSEIARVTRQRLFTDVVVSRALRCPLVLSDYEGSTELDGRGTGATHLLGGWTGDGGDRWITVDERASLGFALKRDADALEIEVTGSADGTVTFMLNNRPARVRETERGWVLSPEGRLPLLGRRANVVITVVPAGGETRITGFKVLEGVE